MMQLESISLSTNPKHHIPLNGISNMILYIYVHFFVNLHMPANCSRWHVCPHSRVLYNAPARRTAVIRVSTYVMRAHCSHLAPLAFLATFYHTLDPVYGPWLHLWSWSPLRMLWRALRLSALHWSLERHS